MNSHFMSIAILISIVTLAVLVLCSGPALAEPWSPSCRDAIAHLRRAQESVKAKQVEVTKAERGERIRFERAEICQPGGIIVAGRGGRVCALLARRADCDSRIGRRESRPTTGPGSI